MVIGSGISNLIVILAALGSALVNIGLPIAILVFLFLIFRKLQRIEEMLGKP